MTLSEVLEELSGLVDKLDPALVSGPEASRLVSMFEHGERLCAAGKVLMTARAVECREWARNGAHSPQEWLSQVSGVPLAAAQRTLDTAERLVWQPEIAGALKSGELSSAQVAEVSSAAKENPAATPRLLHDAKTRGFKGLKKSCRAARLAAASSPADDEAVARRQRESRYLRMWSEPDGTGRIDARLYPAGFNRFASLLHPFEEEVFAKARKAGTREPVERYRADALIALAEAAAGSPASGKARVPAKVIVVVDRNALLRGHAVGDERCEIEGFGPVPVAVARQIMDDAFLAAVVTDGVDIRRVVHLGRHPTEMQKTALAVRDPTCVVPRCERTNGLETHHTPDFDVSRHTTLDELARFCGQHHDDATYHGAILSGGPGDWSWQPPPPHGAFEGPPEGTDPCAGPFDDPPPGSSAGPPEGTDPCAGPFDDPPPGSSAGLFDDPPPGSPAGHQGPAP